MKFITKTVCRTIGAAGMGVALFDAVKVASQFSRNEAQNQQQKYLEKIYYDSRTIDSVSFSNNAIRKGTFDLRTQNPIPSWYGKLKGGFQGFFYGLGNFLPTIVCSTVALLSKGSLAKWGAAGTAITLCYNVARNGFGLGKHHPMD